MHGRKEKSGMLVFPIFLFCALFSLSDDLVSLFLFRGRNETLSRNSFSGLPDLGLSGSDLVTFPASKNGKLEFRGQILANE